MAKPKKTEADELAELCARAQATLGRAGRSLHDNVGPLLSAAGLQLQLLRTDVPAAANQVNQVLQALDQALEHVREVSQELNSSPAQRGGLKHALLHLAERHSRPRRRIAVEYSATAIVPPGIAAALYEAAQRAVAEAIRQRAANVDISVTGERGIHLRIADDGRKRGRARALSVTGRLSREAGLTFVILTGKSTIVSIRHAFRRSTGR